MFVRKRLRTAGPIWQIFVFVVVLTRFKEIMQKFLRKLENSGITEILDIQFTPFFEVFLN